MKFKILCLPLFIFLLQGVAFADSEVDCSSSCDDGKVMTSYADGNDVTCLCVESAQMDPTVSDPEVPTGIDPDNTY